MAAPRLAEALFPIRRRAKLLARPIVPAKLIVRSTFVRVLEHFVCFLNVLELLFRVLFLADVGMVLASLLAITRALTSFRVGAARHTESFVVILELHASNLAVIFIETGA